VHPIVPFASSAPMPPNWPFIRQQVLVAAAHTCFRCGGWAGEVHHVIARADGGGDSPFNLRAVCHPCHLILTGEMPA
jgi:5-methylcytosine-specific restriction endonuclease McrA